jgi:Ca2+-binding EF-hand superfamily protein
MPASALLLILAAAAAPVPAEKPIFVTGYAGRPFISPMGEPFRARSSIDDALERWFRQADRNQDGALTADEMQADAARFFAKLDTDGNGDIDPEEVINYEWEVAPEIQVNARLRRPGGEKLPAGEDEQQHRRTMTTAGIGGGLQGAARYALLNIPEPVVAADVNLDRSITLGEFRQAGLERFQLLDASHSGRLSLAQLKALLPPAKGRRVNRPVDSPDDRYGVPLPPADGQSR